MRCEENAEMRVHQVFFFSVSLPHSPSLSAEGREEMATSVMFFCQPVFKKKLLPEMIGYSLTQRGEE